jgi:PAS domain-containing protein
MRKDGSFHLFSVDKARAAPYLYPVEAAAGTGPSELVYVWDIATGEQKWFGDVDAALGFKPGEFPRTSDAWESRVHPKDYPRILEAAEKHLLSGEPFLEKYRMKKADGTYATWLDCGTVMRDATKRPYKWVGMTREIA